jgi:predicted DNA-binding transcriptional regulator AlpA
MQANYFTAHEAAKYTGISESYLAKLRMGTSAISGPRFVRIGIRAIRYKRTDLDVWMDARGSTYEPGAA